MHCSQITRLAHPRVSTPARPTVPAPQQSCSFSRLWRCIVGFRFCIVSNVGSSLPYCSLTELPSFLRWRTQGDISERLWRDYARLAWDISPALSVYLPPRFASSVALLKEVISESPFTMTFPSCVVWNVALQGGWTFAPYMRRTIKFVSSLARNTTSGRMAIA